MKRRKYLLYLLILAIFICCGQVSAAPEKISGKTYINARFQYSIHIPNMYKVTRESDNNDGITLETKAKDSVLLVWGQHNIDNLDGNALLQQALTRVSHIKSKASDRNFYFIKYSDEGGKEGKEKYFYEYGIVNQNTIAVFELRYPAGKGAKFSQIAQNLQNSLHFSRNIYVLLEALAYSQSLHYDAFQTAPDNITTNYVIHALVRQEQFENPLDPSRKLELQDGTYYFSDGPESEQKFDPKDYFSPQQLYLSYFTAGEYVYPPSDFVLVQGTQTGIMVHMSDPPWHVSVNILKQTDKGDKKIFEIDISRKANDDGTGVKIGKATVTFKKDLKSFFGYTIFSYQPHYPKFKDIEVK